MQRRKREPVRERALEFTASGGGVNAKTPRRKGAMGKISFWIALFLCVFASLRFVRMNRGNHSFHRTPRPRQDDEQPGQGDG
jgi:hypothetical protein